jgi:hypothetical protein
MTAIWGSGRKRLLIFSLLGLLLSKPTFVLATPRMVSAVDSSQRITLPGNVHPLAQP